MKSKILFILHLPPPIHGAGMMGSYIKESVLIQNKFESDYINLSLASSIDDIGKAGLKKAFTLISLLLKIGYTLLTKKHDLYYMTLTAAGPGFYKDLLIVFLLKVFRKKIVYHFHNKGVSSNQSKKSKALYTFVFKNSKSILLSPALYKDIEQYVAKQNVYFCANGIPNENIQPSSKFVAKKTQPCNLIFLSNLMEEKGVYILLEACKWLKENNVPFNCHFIGPWGDVTESLFNQKVADFGISDRIIIHGRKYGPEKTKLLQEADIFVFPTYYHNECFPLVLLEAMQVGLPIISTFEGGISDIITENETGLLCKQKNAEELAVKIKLLIDNSVIRESFGVAGRKKFDNNFTIIHFENNLAQILQTIIHQNHTIPSK